MMIVEPRLGERFPASGSHREHEARIVAVDLHGQHSYDPSPADRPPTVTVLCSCRALWVEELPDAVA